MDAAAHSALYLSVPFCRTKCSFCNFASGVFSRELFDRYIAHLERDIASAPTLAREVGSHFDPVLDSVYLGGGTPSVLAPDQLDRLFTAVRHTFSLSPQIEFTVEVAPGTLSDEILAVLCRAGVNRVSLGVQSFIDQESRSVGRLHTREITLRDIARLREAGISEISVDLIAGLPYQTAESWDASLTEVLTLAVPHVSVYMLEIDDDSRLGRELIAGGTRYHAHHVPNEDLTVTLYECACLRLNDAGILQYEISNFARPGHQSRHNLRYWQRLPYFGFGVDAHSMLLAPAPHQPHRAVRIANADSLDAYLAGVTPERTIITTPAPAAGSEALPASAAAGSGALPASAAAGSGALPASAAAGSGALPVPVLSERTIITTQQAIEETYFLGLRMTQGLELLAIKEEFGIAAVDQYREVITDLVDRGLLAIEDGWLCLTPQGRLLSNEVFADFLRD